MPKRHHASPLKSATFSRHAILPAWLTTPQSISYSGLGRSLIYKLADQTLIISAVVRSAGSTRGRRLFNRESIDRFIEAGIGEKCADNTKRASPARRGRE